MSSGLVTIIAYLVILLTISIILHSWSPSCRNGSDVLLTVVSYLTCPDMISIGNESTHAPNTPFSVLIPPGPVVTLTTGIFRVKRA